MNIAALVGLPVFLASICVGLKLCLAPHEIIKYIPLAGCGLMLGVLMSVGFIANRWTYW